MMNEPLIQWRDSFALGVASVDREHRELIELINQLHAAIQVPGSEIAVYGFLGNLLTQTSAHFALEEELMRDASYGRYPQHKADHERLLDEIRDLMDDFESGRHVSMELLAARLENWFTGHFREEDARLHHVLG